VLKFSGQEKHFWRRLDPWWISKETLGKSENEFSWKLALIIDLSNGEEHRSESSIDLER